MSEQNCTVISSRNQVNNEESVKCRTKKILTRFFARKHKIACGADVSIACGKTSMSLILKDVFSDITTSDGVCSCVVCVSCSGYCWRSDRVGVQLCGVSRMVKTVGDVRAIAVERLGILSDELQMLRVVVRCAGQPLLHDHIHMRNYNHYGYISVAIEGSLKGGNPVFVTQGILLRRKVNLTAAPLIAEKVEEELREQPISSTDEDETFVGSLIERLGPQYNNMLLNMAISGQYVSGLLDQHKDSVKFLEDIVIFLYQIWKSKTMQERSVAVVNFIKLRTGSSVACSSLKNLIMYAVNAYFKYHTQTMSFKDVLNGYRAAKKSPLCKKLHKFSLMVIGVSLFDKIGMKIEAEKVHRLAENGVEKCEWKSLDFIHTIIDTIQFVCERGYQCMQMGSWQPLFHSGKNYEIWFEEAKELMRLSKLTSHFGLENMTDEEFTSRLDKSIEIGEAMIGALKMQQDESLRYVVSMVGELKLTRTLYRARSSASASRVEPLGVVLFGGSCVMKSQLQDLIGYHYGKIMNIPTGCEHKYVRNYRDKNWSGYNGQWWIVLDEIAPYKPAQVQGIDPTIEELQVIINTMAVITTQAELENKGKIPLKPRLVTATTNVEDLNAGLYYMNPLAVRRRVPFQVTVEIKPEYRQIDEFGNVTEMVDPSRIPEVEEGDYLNVWNLTVKRVVGKRDPSTGKQYAMTEVVQKFEDIYDFLECFSKFAIKKSEILKKSEIDRERMFSVKLCSDCHRPMDHCKCRDLFGQRFQAQGDVKCASCNNEIQECGCRHPDHEHKNCTCIWTRCEVDARTPTAYVVLDEDGLRSNVPAYDVRQIGGDFYTLLPFEPSPGFYAALNEEAEMITKIAETMVPSRENPIRAWIVRTFMDRYMRHTWLQETVKRCMYISWLRSVFIWFALVLVPRPCRALFLFLGHTVEVKYRQHPLLFKIAGLAAILGSSWCVMSWFRRNDDQCTWTWKQVEDHTRSCMSDERDLNRHEEQVKILQPEVDQTHVVQHEACEQPSIVPMEREFENQWALHDIKLMDRPDRPMQVSWKNMSDDEIATAIKHNCVTLTVVGNGERRVNNAFCVVGHWYIVNTHSWIPNGKVTIKFGAQGRGIMAEQTFECGKLKTVRWKQSDVMFVEFLSLPVRRDLRELFSVHNVDARGRAVVFKLRDWSIEMEHLVKARLFQSVTIGESTTMCFSALSRAGMAEGDCGSPWFIRTSGSTFIAGIHYWQLTGTNEVGCAQVTRQMIDECIGEGPFVQQSQPILKQGDCELVIGGLRKHSHVSYIEQGSAIVYGSRPGFRRSPKSTVRSTCIADFCKQRGYEVDFAAPDMNWRSYHKALKDMTQINVGMDNTLLRKCAEAFARDVQCYATEKAIIITQSESINGIDGVAYIDAMNRKTSAGAPFWKNKKHYLNQSIDGKWELSHKLQDVVDEYMARYARGERCVPIYSTAQKDEPKKRAKCRDGARIFICSSLPWCIVVRRYLMWFVRLMQNNRMGFECAVGVSPQCVEWKILLQYLNKMSPNKFAGDYKAYDKQMGANVIVTIFELVAEVAKMCQADESMVLAILAIGEDVAFAFVDFDGDLMMFLGGNPSGHPLTVIVNCLCGSLYMRYAFCKITNRDPKEFKKYVALLTYGDDNVVSVSPELPEFNHTTVMQSLAECDITYTMADKISESTPYQHIDEITFLKRYWREDGDRTLAPLERESIIKMLTIHTVSKSLCEEEQTCCAMQSAVREAAMHGEEYYNEIRQLCEDAIFACNLQAWADPFPSFQYLMRCWDENSIRILEVYKSRGGISGLDYQDYSELMSYCDKLSARIEHGIIYEEKQ